MKNQHILKNIFSLAISCFWCSFAFSQDQVVKSTPGSRQFESIMLWVFMAVIAVLVVVTTFTVLKVLGLYQKLLAEAYARERGIVIEAPTLIAQKESAGPSIWKQIFGTGAVAIEHEADILLAHPHDGIYELDNKLPPWWVNLFIATIVFAFSYIGYYHFYLEGTHGQIYEYTKAIEEGKIQKEEAMEKQKNSVNENTVVALNEPQILDGGKAIFLEKCAVCHGQKGEGGVGPNMTDDYWLHGGGIKNVFTTIKYGVPEKGMISWKEQLRPAEMQAVASYILTLKGTNPPNPKAPQGVLYVPTDTIKNK